MFGFWSVDENERFCRLVERVAEQAGMPGSVEVERGALVAGAFRLSLETLARQCREQPEEDWRNLVVKELVAAVQMRTTTERLARVGLEEARPLLRSVVLREGPEVDACVHRPIGADLVEALMLNLPDRRLMAVNPDRVSQWRVGRAELFATGRENLRAEPFERWELAELGLYELHGCDGSLAAAQLLRLDERPEIGRYGCIVVVPNQQSLAFHPIEGPDCLGHAEAWATLLNFASREGIHQRISDALYWWRSGVLTEIPASWQGNQLQVAVPDSFISMLEGGEPETEPAAAPDDTDPAYGDPETMATLGALLLMAGRRGDAEPWLRRAAARGHLEAMCNLGTAYLQSGRVQEAERWFRRAADRDDDFALAKLGALFDHTGRTEEAERWYRTAAQRGGKFGPHLLGRFLHETGRAEEAQGWFRRAAEAGNADAMVDLCRPLLDAKRYGEAEPWLRQAAERQQSEAMFGLGLLLNWTDRAVEGGEWIAKAAERGHRPARELAERWFATYAEQGYPRSMRRLAKLLADADRTDEAQDWYRRAADAGDHEAMRELGMALKQTGDTAGAESWYHRAIESGNVEAMYHLGYLLLETGRTAEAEQWYRSAADHGVVKAMTNLSALLYQSGRATAAEEWVRRAADLGSAAAMRNLGQMRVMQAAEHRKAGEHAAADAALAEAEEWYRRGGEAGNAEALLQLGLLLEASRPEEARQWYCRAAEAGHHEALDRLAALLDR